VAARPDVVCLLPARDAAADLPDYLDSAARICDAVVALDDGSTDDTAALLEASPLVARLLRNPRREGFRGWNDSRNRNQLLDAAAELRPRWILSLDADERIDAEDAVVLRSFLAVEARPECVYALARFRMFEDEAFDPSFSWMWRVFGFRPGLRLADRRLHFHLVPMTVPPDRWLRTTVRIKHLSTSSQERRDAIAAKYGEADPAGAWGTNLDGLIGRPEEDLPRWKRRPEGLPILVPDSIPGGAPPFRGTWPIPC
jgi:glycosyltransferase involved in cell wall biosynthesis